MDNLWNKSPQTWTAYGLEWRFEYSYLTAKRTITATGFNLEVKIAEISRFPHPQAWLAAWAKKNKNQLPPEPETAVNLELDLFPQAEALSADRQAVQVEVVTDDLTPEEERDRLILERQVERAFYQAGKALKKLRDRRLYRSTHPNFEEYVQDRFGMKRAHSYRLIDAANVVDNLSSRCLQIGDNLPQLPAESMSPIGGQKSLGDNKVSGGTPILPTNEAQCRPLTQLEPSQQREVWQQAVEAAGGKVPSGRLVKDIVQRIRERTQVPIPYRVGDVCEIIVKDNPDLRGLGGCWCVVTEVREFSCLVRTWKGEYQVREENLKDLGYSPDQQEAMRKISDRLVPLQSLQDEETAAAILSALGKLKRPYLNPLEENLLEVLTEFSSKTRL